VHIGNSSLRRLQEVGQSLTPAYNNNNYYYYHHNYDGQEKTYCAAEQSDKL